jgi:hypothetical protein
VTTTAGFTARELAELAEIHRRQARDALAEPATLAQFCDPTFTRRPHIDFISRELARVADGEFDRLLIAVPPQTGKTTLAGVWTPFWWLARNPAARVIIGSYSSNLATGRGKQVRKLVQRQGWRYGLEVEWGSGQVNDWQLTSGGGVASRGVGAGVTGLPGDLLILDDVHKSRAEAESPTLRDAVWDWYSADMLSRLAPGAPVILIMTLWHVDDIAHRVIKQDGTLEDGGRWRVVKLPAFAGVDDPLGREPGEPLTHPKIAPEDTERLREFWERRRAETTARDWASLYLCDPKPVSSALVESTMLRDRTHTPPPAAPRKAAVAIDPSGGGRDTAGVIGGWLGDDDRVYITHDVSLVGTSEQWSKAAVLLAAELDADTIVYEGNFGGDLNEVALKSAWEQARREHPTDKRYTRPMPRLKKTTAKKGKLLRAEPIAQQFILDKLRLGAHLPELVAEWTSWQPTDTNSPGRIDASVYLAYELLPMNNEPARVAAHPALAPGRAAGPVAGNPYLGTLPGMNTGRGGWAGGGNPYTR